MNYAYDSKYGKVTTEFGEFHPGEPVIVFRARDVLAVRVLDYYLNLCIQDECSDIHKMIVQATTLRFENWALKNPLLVQVPSSLVYVKRLQLERAEIMSRKPNVDVDIVSKAEDTLAGKDEIERKHADERLSESIHQASNGQAYLRLQYLLQIYRNGRTPQWIKNKLARVI